jgi:asparagine synthetase A
VKKLYATVDWDASKKLRSKLRVLCTLKHNVPKVYELVKTWKQSVEDKMAEILQDNVTYHKQDVARQFWESFLEQTRKDTEKAQADSKNLFVVYYDDKNCCIEVVGLTDYVEPTVKRLQKLVPRVV